MRQFVCDTSPNSNKCPSLYYYIFYARIVLLCATARQSYCRHAGVSSLARPSLVRKTKGFFSEPIKQINAKFGGKIDYLFKHRVNRRFNLHATLAAARCYDSTTCVNRLDMPGTKPHNLPCLGLHHQSILCFDMCGSSRFDRVNLRQ